MRQRRLAPEFVIFPTAPASPLFHAGATPLCRIVHDVFPWMRDRAMPLKGRLLYRDVENLMARRYDRLLGTTELVARDLGAQVRRNDVTACGNAPGVDPDGPESAPANAPENFILAVGTVEPRKNYGRLVELVESESAAALPVVLVGRPGWGAVVQTIERLADARPGRLIWLRDLTSDDGLRWLYRRAACFLSLSQAEGFNMPLVESAMSARPILCSDLADSSRCCAALGEVRSALRRGRQSVARNRRGLGVAPFAGGCRCLSSDFRMEQDRVATSSKHRDGFGNRIYS